MAVNTRNRRFAMMAIGDVDSIMPNPDGSLANAADRLQILQLYPGITPSGGSAPDPVVKHKGRDWTAQMRRRGVR